MQLTDSIIIKPNIGMPNSFVLSNNVLRTVTIIDKDIITSIIPSPYITASLTPVKTWRSISYTYTGSKIFLTYYSKYKNSHVSFCIETFRQIFDLELGFTPPDFIYFRPSTPTEIALMRKSFDSYCLTQKSSN